MKALVFALAVAAAVPATAQTMSPADYVKTAGASDLYERQSSRLVLETTRDRHVRDFARMMVVQHTESTADVKAAAMRAHVRVAPAMLTPAQAGMIAQLRAARGPARDTTYIAQQKDAHAQALTAQQAYATGGTAVPLRRVAVGIVPVVKRHMAMLDAM